LSDGWTESEKSTVKIEMRKVKGGHKGISFLKSMGSKKKKATTKKPVTKSKKTQGSNKPPSAGTKIFAEGFVGDISDIEITRYNFKFRYILKVLIM